MTKRRPLRIAQSTPITILPQHEEGDSLFVTDNEVSQASGERGRSAFRSPSPAWSVDHSIASDIDDSDIEDRPLEPINHVIVKRPNIAPSDGSDDETPVGEDPASGPVDSVMGDDWFPNPEDLEPENDPDSEDYVLQPGDPGFIGPICEFSSGLATVRPIHLKPIR